MLTKPLPLNDLRGHFLFFGNFLMDLRFKIFVRKDLISSSELKLFRQKTSSYFFNKIKFPIVLFF
jgi:hypothetical protein